MKLKSFLAESAESTKTWAEISKFDQEHSAAVKKILGAIKGFKFVEESIENPEDSHDGRGRINATFSDGLLNIILTVSTSETDGKLEFGFLMLSAKVQQKYLVNVKDNRPDLTYFSLFHNNLDELDEKLNGFMGAVSEFTDWYFDMSGTYGKLKLFKTFYDILGGAHDNNKPRFVAIAGDFQCTDEVGGAKTFRMEPRVL